MDTIRLIVVVSVAILSQSANAAHLYVDPWFADHVDATWSEVDGESYSSTAAEFPGPGAGYLTLQAAVDALQAGDDVWLRGGTYQTNELGGAAGNTVVLPNVDGTPQDWCSIQSFPGEWATLDGQSNTSDRPWDGVLVGSLSGGSEYWRFERFALVNVTNNPTLQEQSGIRVARGPVIFRYLYFENIGVANPGTNCAAIYAHFVQDSTVEYCVFNNCGDPASGGNGASMEFCSDYAGGRMTAIAEDGFFATGAYLKNNVVRYNLFSGGHIGIKDTKGQQFFTGRSIDDGDQGYTDTYNNFGNKHHHNIFLNMSHHGIALKTDFGQIHHNIMDAAGGILNGYETAIYKPAIYNNTIVNSGSMVDGVVAMGGAAFKKSNFSFSHEPSLFGYYYNNIIDGVSDSHGVCEIGFGRDNLGPGQTILDLDTLEIEAVYLYRPGPSATSAVSVDAPDAPLVSYSISQWQALHPTHLIYSNAYDAENLLYRGTSGAEKYKIIADHVVDTGVTAGSGGRDGIHPYLAGVTIPAHFGAANPNDDGWIAQVMALDEGMFTFATGQGDAVYDATWIEGAGPDIVPPVIYPNNPAAPLTCP